MRLESCRHFDTELFIKQLKIWRKEKERLLERLEEIPLLPSSNNNGIRSSEISDATARIAIKRLEIEDEIKDIERCEAVYEIAKKSLTREELEVFELFFEPKKPIWKEIDEYTYSHYTSRMCVYRERRKILEKLDKLIAGKCETW